MNEAASSDRLKCFLLILLAFVLMPAGIERGDCLFFILFIYLFFSHPIYYLRPSILSLLVVTQIRGHIAGSSPLSLIHI